MIEPIPEACRDCGSTEKKLFAIHWKMKNAPAPPGYPRWCAACRHRDWHRKRGRPARTRRTPEEQRAIYAQAARERHQRRRQQALLAYGGKCACCGESESAFLAVDHIDGGGNAHRRSLTSSGEIAGSSNFYGWLERAGYPTDRFQLLCHNCNFAKSHGGCPHEEKK